MNDVVPKFPLLRIPEPAILNTMRAMDHLEIFGISILSNKAKNLVESLKLQASDVYVWVFDDFDVDLQFHNHDPLNFSLYQVNENEPIQELETPEDIYITNEDTTVIWTNWMSVKQMLDHFQFIFHAPITKLYFGDYCERFSLESIHKNVKQFESICLKSGNHEHNRRILNMFQPAILDLRNDALIDGHAPKYISIQNFAMFIFREENVLIDLNDLLMMNARTIFFDCFSVSVAILNQFLRLWMKGSNPRLECMLLSFRRMGFQIDDVMRKLDHKVAPRDRLRLFQSNIEERQMRVIGGRDIGRSDGTQATIVYKRRGDIVYFNLFVWHDHCVLN